jgi:cobalt/nickel transport system permease protein
MHIPDGFLSAPVYVAGYAVSGAVCAVAVARANRNLGEKEVPLLGMTAAFIFAVQMLNFPVAGGTSGHFLGATLAAVLLGPLNACLVMAVVLTIQCLGFADGGLTALGANLFNMGIIGAIGGWLLFRGLRGVLPKSRWAFLAAAAAASWAAVVVASAICAGELAWSGTSPLQVALPAMAGVHALIGIGEAIITAAVLSSVLAVRPDLVAAWDRTPECGVRSAECGVQEARP